MGPFSGGGRRWLRATAAALAALVLACSAALAAPSGSGVERVLRFESAVTLHADSTLTVRERFRVRSNGERMGYGVYHVVLTRGAPPNDSRRAAPRIFVTDVLADGQPAAYALTEERAGTEVMIGSPGVELPRGEHTYELQYDVDGAVTFAAGGDTLTWPATGGWSFPIDTASVRVELPLATDRLLGWDAATGQTWVGGRWLPERAYTVAAGGANELILETSAALHSVDGLVVSLIVPKGVLAPPTLASRVGILLRHDVPGLLMLAACVLLLAYYLVVWVMVGRDRPRRTIIPLFEPPRGLSPAAVRFLARLECDDKTVAVAVVNLAVQGALSIHWSADCYELVPPRARRTPRAQEEQRLAAALLQDGPIRLSPVKHAAIQTACKTLGASLGAQYEGAEFFSNDRHLFAGWGLWAACLLAAATLGWNHAGPLVLVWIWTTVFALAAVGLLLALPHRWRVALASVGHRVGAFARAASISVLTILVCAGVGLAIVKLAELTTPARTAALLAVTALNAVFYVLLKAPTDAGRRVMDEIEGFRMFLSVVGPEGGVDQRTRPLFERYLPYALALDVELEWAAHFRPVLCASAGDGAYAPAWLIAEGARQDGLELVLTLGDRLAEAITSACRPPRSRRRAVGDGIA